MSRIIKGLGVAAALWLAICPVKSQAETQAGVARTVQNHVFSITKGNQQPLTVGKEVYMDDRVRTEDDSETQLLLLDQTNFTIGPKSNVVLDRFVFDPNKPKGDVVINVTQGVFRFVTGTQDSSSYHIKTPVATMGVRGTVLEINSFVDPTTGKPTAEFHLVKGGFDLTITNPASPEFAFIAVDQSDILITVSDGKYKTSSWVAQNSLYAARAGDVTGAIGAAGAGGASGGQTASVQHGATNTGDNGGNGGGGGGGGGGTVFTFTPTTTSQPVSP